MPALRHLPLPFPSAMRALAALALALGAGPATGCGGEPPARDTAPEVTEVAADEGVLLDREGRLEAGDLQLGPGFSDHYEVAVRAGDRVSVEVRSTELDPLLEVTPPRGEPLVNDDWQGDRQRARVELVAEREGIVKVRVTSYAPGATGAYTVRAERTPAPTDPSSVAAAAEQVQELEPGASMEGRLGPGDARLSDGAFYDRLVVDVPASGSLELHVTTGGSTFPRVEVLNPDGRALAATSPGVFSLVEPGIHRILVAGPGRDAELAYAAQLRRAERATPRLARDHHQLPTQGGSSRIEMDRPVDGALAEGDRTLPTGELADIYSLAGRAGSSINLEMTSEAVDPYLIVIGPDGRHWENDDVGGSLNAGLVVTLPADGTYRVVATSYRAGESGGYRLKASREQRAVRDQAVATGTPSSPAAPPATTGPRTASGSLAPGDTRLGSGEFVDEHVFEWPAGRHVRLEARSGDFDTYLMVRGPGGFQEDNDDPQPGNTNAAIDLVTPTAGAYRVLVTSYRPGEQGAYRLLIGDEAGEPDRGAAPASESGEATRPGQELRGELAAGDAQLRSGEHVDSQSLRFEPGRPVRIRLESSDFDPYLIVRTPGGRQIDNDDLEPGNLSAGVDLPRAESGEYVVMVTSYSPGETGAWVLRVEEGPAVATPTLVDGGGSTGSTGSTEGGRVFGVFAGITDYPAGVGDLPECANDAIKLAQTLREGGLLTEDRQVLLTDGQVTRANLRAAMAQMAERVGPEDVFVFFYSGHGGRAEGRPTSDSREIDGADEYLYLHDGELLDDEMGRMFDGISARVSMVALDACFSGGFAKDVITRPGRVGLFSSEEDVTSAVAGAFQAGGYLSHFLRMGVAGEADLAPRDSVLTVGELTHYLTLQFGRHVRDVRMSEGYQHLVVDRGAVGSDDVMWAYR